VTAVQPKLYRETSPQQGGAT